MTLDEAQVRRATRALLKHVKISTSVKPSLLEEEGEVILAQISLHKIPDKVTAKPHRIEIPHPLRQQDDCDMCLFVKDNAKAWIKEMIEKEPVAGLAKIIKLEKLRTQYHEFNDRRQLLSQYDLFLADDRILPMLTKALGKVFLKVKKQPIPIGLERRSSLAKQIARARESAFLCGSHGDCWSVKLANIVMTEDQVVENLMAGLTAVVDKIPRKWKNVKAINIKTSKSIALPVYSNVGDIPPTPKSEAMEVAAPVKANLELDSMASRNTTDKTKKTNNTKVDGSDKTDITRKSVVNEKMRKPRPLIRQQLRRIKEEAKAEKKSTSPATASSAKNSKVSPRGNRKSTNKEIRGTENNSLQVGKKRASSDNAETTSAKGQGEEMGKHGRDRRNEKKSTNVKRKSAALASPVVRKARGGKRRKAEGE